MQSFKILLVDDKLLNYLIEEYGSPGLVVMVGDSHSEGRGFKSRHRILDGHDNFHIDFL